MSTDELTVFKEAAVSILTRYGGGMLLSDFCSCFKAEKGESINMLHRLKKDASKNNKVVLAFLQKAEDILDVAFVFRDDYFIQLKSKGNGN